MDDIIYKLHDKISDVGGEIAEVRGLLEGALPNLATKDDLNGKVNERLSSHVDDWHSNKTSLSKKQLAAIIGAAVTLMSAISAALTHFIGAG